jgi:prolipoprotein diacylglyceryltransferase
MKTLRIAFYGIMILIGFCAAMTVESVLSLSKSHHSKNHRGN